MRFKNYYKLKWGINLRLLNLFLLINKGENTLSNKSILEIIQNNIKNNNANNVNIMNRIIEKTNILFKKLTSIFQDNIEVEKNKNITIIN